jgi:hypothetical protein
MTDIVWVSRAFGDTELMLPFHRNHTVAEDALIGDGTLQGLIYEGVPLAAEVFATDVYRNSDTKAWQKKLPDIFHAAGYLVVSSAAAAILRQFDLGHGGLFPLQILEDDETTLVAGEYFCLSIGNQKSAFLPEASVGAKQRNIRVGVPGWKPPFVLTDDAFAVSEVALEGPDVWVDTIVGDAFFLSNSLSLALKKAKADKGFSLRTCRVIMI